MKKIIFTFISLCFMGIVFADIDFTEAIQSTSMPTDAEIRNTISQFNFDEKQKEELFKETKKKLQEIYSGQNMEQTNAELNQYYSIMDSKELDPYINNSTRREIKREVSKLPKTDSSSSKTTKKIIYSDSEKE